MHIEPGIVDGARMALAYATAAASAGYTLKLAADDLRTQDAAAFAVRAVLASIGTLICFEVLPHFAAGVSEVHFILGTTLFLILGAAPSAIGLAAGLLIQGLVMAPADLPMFFVNVTTLLMPLFAIDALARRIIPPGRAYVDLRYADVFALSLAYQGGIVAWVAFWVIYGQGAGAETMADLLRFGAAYMIVVLIEPIADLAVLWLARRLRPAGPSPFVARRLYTA